MPQKVQEVASTQPPIFSDYDLFPAQPTIKTYYVKSADVQTAKPTIKTRYVNPANIPAEYLPPQYRDGYLFVDMATDANYNFPIAFSNMLL